MMIQCQSVVMQNRAVVDTGR